MSLLEQIRQFPTAAELAQSLRDQNPGFDRTPKLAILYSQSIHHALEHRKDDHACRLYRLALTA